LNIIETDRPPSEPPAGCDRLMWSLAIGLLGTHDDEIDASCTGGAVACRHCQLAYQGLSTSLGIRSSLSPFWVGYTEAIALALDSGGGGGD